MALTIWQTQKGNSMVFLSLYNNGTLHLYSTFHVFRAFSCLLPGLILMKQKPHVFCNCLYYKDSLGIRASETLCWRRTDAPNCFKNNKSHISCKWSQQDNTAIQLFHGERIHLERRNQFSTSQEPLGILIWVAGLLCRRCLGRGCYPVLTVGRDRDWRVLQGLRGH